MRVLYIQHKTALPSSSRLHPSSFLTDPNPAADSCLLQKQPKHALTLAMLLRLCWEVQRSCWTENRFSVRTSPASQLKLPSEPDRQSDKRHRAQTAPSMLLWIPHHQQLPIHLLIQVTALTFSTLHALLYPLEGNRNLRPFKTALLSYLLICNTPWAFSRHLN